MRRHGFELAALPGVYEPAEDSDLLVDAIQALPEALCTGARAVDVGTGTGIAAMAMARRGARVVAVDLNPLACRLTRHNAAANGLRVDVVQGDLLAALEGPFDVIVSNPPYLPTTEDERRGDLEELALDGGPTGLAPTLRLVEQTARRLAPGGVALVLASTLAPLDVLEAAANEAGFEADIARETSLGLESLRVYALQRDPR